MNFEGLSISVYFLDDVMDVMSTINEAQFENTRNMYIEALSKLVFKHDYMPRTGDAIFGSPDPNEYFYVAEVAFEEQRICFYLTTKDIVQQLTATN